MFRKGQVSTEYLVILAVVLVVALVVVALVSGMSPLSSGVSASQSANYWAGVSPFAITAWKYTGTTLQMTVMNQAGQQVTLKSISGGTVGVNTFNTTMNATVLAVGQVLPVTATSTAQCSGTFDFANVVITYDQGGITDLHQNGAKDIVGTCSP
jgi:uncharacterized protein (UPF0333 family)